MKTIRTNTFETNSSSTHSLTLIQEPFEKDRLYFTEDGEYVIERNEFGWQFNKFNDANKKISYLAIFSLDYDNIQLQEWLEEIILEEGAKKVVWYPKFKIADGEYCPFYNCYIDHSGEAKNLKEVISSKQTVYDFVMNKKSWLFLGNDNSTPNPDFRKTEEEIDESTHIISSYNDDIASYDDMEVFHYNFVKNDKSFKESVENFFRYIEQKKPEYFNRKKKGFLSVVDIKVKKTGKKVKRMAGHRIYVKWQRETYNYDHSKKTSNIEILEEGTTIFSMFSQNRP